MKCPRDSDALVPSTRKRVEIDVCPTCQGVWLDPKELAELIGSWRDLPRAQQAQADPLSCPRGCGPMTPCYYSELRQVLIDRCPRCQGIWLDHREIEWILNEVYRYRGSPG